MDGELARAKSMASEWGRIVDGIGDDVSGMAILIGLMIGVPESRGELMVLTALIFLRGITFDYFKEYMMGRVTYGYDGPGPDLIFFSSPCFPSFAVLEHSIRWLSGFMLAQMLVTFIFHHQIINHEKDS
ncbi:MAG: hypothetical protein E2O43_00725 [Nitrospina sp.]|nr:MAG: hypothetical protein E2O43_00725 [Nitrospina sp.]